MPLQQRRSREKVQMRQLILDAAKDIAAQHGWQNVTIRKLCAQINYSAPIVYQYFDTKECLMQSLRKEGMSQMAVKIKSIYESEKNPHKQLQAYGFAFWQFALEHPELYQVMFNLQGAMCEDENGQSPVEEINSYYAASIRALQPDVHISSKQMLALIDYYIAVIHGFIALNMVNKIKSGKDNAEQVFKKSLKHFIESIAINK